MPIAKSQRLRGISSRALTRDLIRVFARFSPKRRSLDLVKPSEDLAGSRSKLASLSKLSEKRSRGEAASLVSTNLIATDSPSPSRSRALRPAK